MADDETVLTSFVTEDESLLDTWAVRGVGDGTSRVPPATDSGELLAITDRRLLWFEGELFDVELTADTDVEYRDYSHTSTPTIVSVAWLLFGLSAFVTAGAFLFLDVDTLTAALPIVSGLGVVLLAIVVARARGETGEEVDLHRFVVESGDDDATIWCEEEDVTDLREALGAESATAEPDEDAPDADDGDERPDAAVDTDDRSDVADANEDPVDADGDGERDTNEDGAGESRDATTDTDDR